ncbi:hypothetical protein U5A82_17490 [Sphingobium sp. CR2-8]|uniref:hypothetical protein n=1 Tax=Sphingobium sp. CR2-8 TaxID=1306534 RepID=UPI002DB9F5E9|nr:hypothetical protein [Sphingobium sp. CR2-8]MEC3912203.1 hypothetical protein [Sphingobium sp. CR2-8]
MKGPGWPDARGWIGIGSYGLVVLVILLIWADRTLLNNDFFKVIATAIVLTGWNGGPLSWAYSATKSGGELADRNADLVQRQAEDKK